VTAALFDLGKFVIGFYLGRLGIESSYAGAASVLVLLLWVYYSAQIVLLGAEFTHVYSNRSTIIA
jgi:membrane protein